MDREQSIGITIVVLSVVFDYLAFLWKVEFMQFVLTFLAGSFSTYVVQHKLQAESEKRESRRRNALVMRDRVYGPLLMTLSHILESVRSSRNTEYSILQNLDKIIEDYLLYTIPKALKDKLLAIRDRIDKYERINRATEIALISATREEARQIYQVDIGQAQNNAFLRLETGGVQTSSATIAELLFQRMTPKRFMEAETKKWGDTITVQGRIGGTDRDLDSLERFYNDVLQRVEKNNLFQEEKKQKDALVAELEKYLSQLKPHVI